MAVESIDVPFTAAGRQALCRLLAKSGVGDITCNPMAVALVVAFLALVGWIALETQANRDTIHANGVAIVVLQTNVAAMDVRLEKLETRMGSLEASQIELHRKIDMLLARQSR